MPSHHRRLRTSDEVRPALSLSPQRLETNVDCINGIRDDAVRKSRHWFGGSGGVLILNTETCVYSNRVNRRCASYIGHWQENVLVFSTHCNIDEEAS